MTVDLGCCSRKSGGTLDISAGEKKQKNFLCGNWAGRRSPDPTIWGWTWTESIRNCNRVDADVFIIVPKPGDHETAKPTLKDAGKTGMTSSTQAVLDSAGRGQTGTSYRAAWADLDIFISQKTKFSLMLGSNNYKLWFLFVLNLIFLWRINVLVCRYSLSSRQQRKSSSKFPARN